MLMQPSPMAETSRLPSLRFCMIESFLAVECWNELIHWFQQKDMGDLSVPFSLMQLA